MVITSNSNNFKMKNIKTSSLEKISEKTDRTLRVWLKGKKEDLRVYRIPISDLYFNIENGRYADKMIQLKADNPSIDIDPKKEKWRDEIYNMLKGDYKGSIDIGGTEDDKLEFNRLKDDIKKREQLDPGIVLSDGGVIDGNRRLAVLMDIKEMRFNRFDGVILPEDISAEDRWRIEVGIQLGRDQRLEYSYINKLLKIREGLKLYRQTKLPKGMTPESMVANALYGVQPKEIIDEIERINFIDEFLEFFKMSGQYHSLGAHGERFIEAVKIMKSAEKLQPTQRARLKVQLFVIIKESIMNNRELRDIRKALGGDSKARGRKSNPIQKAVEHLITHASEPKNVKEAYVGKKQQKIVEKTSIICQEFQDIYTAERNSSQPLNLAKDARIKLQTLKESIKLLEKKADKTSILKELGNISGLVKACYTSINQKKLK